MKMMKAMVLTKFGGPENFELRETPIPEPGPNELLVRVHATSVNPVDCKLRQSGTWAGITPPAVIGYDVSGVVEQVGQGVIDFADGDKVYYTPEIFGGQGSYAEYHVVDEAIVANKPANLSHVEAAAIPLAGGTAWTALMERAGLSLGETILIHGVGGVGSATVHLVFLQRERAQLNRLSELIERGQLGPVIDSVMPLTEVAKAHQRLEAGGVKGKIVLQVAES